MILAFSQFNKRLTSLRKISGAFQGQQMSQLKSILPCPYNLGKNKSFGPQILLRKLKGIYLDDKITRKSKFGKFWLSSLLALPSPPSPCLSNCRSVPLARLGLETLALAWPEAALALSNLRPGQSCHSRLGSGLAWLRPWLLYVKAKKARYYQ